MKKKAAIFGTISILLLIGLLNVALKVRPVLAMTLTVPDDYPTIQEAINHASQGDVIFVRNGTYHENVDINKTLTIIGEARSNTILDGYGVQIDHSDAVTITGFTIRNAVRGISFEGSHHCHIYGNNILDNNSSAIFMHSCWYGVVSGNTITNNGGGISIVGLYNNISGNLIVNNSWSGVRLGIGDEHGSYNNISGNVIAGHEYGISFDGAAYNVISCNNITANNIGVDLSTSYKASALLNTISDNNITDNNCAVRLYQSSSSSAWRATENTILRNNVKGNQVGFEINYASNNTIYQNNISNNTLQTSITEPSMVNTWDNGCEGNYWSDYNGTDSDSDGIGDTYLPWQGVDYYPLMNLYWNPSDVNHDLRVDIKDLAFAGKAYGAYIGYPNWNPRVDMNDDGRIDIKDLAIIAKSYGKTYS